jgi:toxin CcdB
LLDELTTRMVAPMLTPDELPRVMRQLNPQFTLRGRSYVMAPQFAGAISVAELGDTIANLTPESHLIIAATDFLFQGF